MSKVGNLEGGLCSSMCTHVPMPTSHRPVCSLHRPPAKLQNTMATSPAGACLPAACKHRVGQGRAANEGGPKHIAARTARVGKLHHGSASL